MFAVKGKAEHPIEGFAAVSDKAARYLLHGMRKHTSDILKEFEAYVIGDIEGTLVFEIILVFTGTPPKD